MFRRYAHQTSARHATTAMVSASTTAKRSAATTSETSGSSHGKPKGGKKSAEPRWPTAADSDNATTTSGLRYMDSASTQRSRADYKQKNFDITDDDFEAPAAAAGSGKNTDGGSFFYPPSGGTSSSSKPRRSGTRRTELDSDFSTVMTHLRNDATRRNLSMEQEMERERRMDRKEFSNVDFSTGYSRESDPVDAEASFFDEGMVDIKGAEKIRKKRAEEEGPTSAFLGKGGNSGRRGGRRGKLDEEDLDRAVGKLASKDILKLSGARRGKKDSFFLDGQHLSTNISGAAAYSPTLGLTNNAPSDITVANDATKGYGDTPTEITDMLHERLMELKAEKLSDEKVTTHMPRRHEFTAMKPKIQMQPKKQQQKTKNVRPTFADEDDRVATKEEQQEADRKREDFRKLAKLLDLDSGMSASAKDTKEGGLTGFDPFDEKASTTLSLTTANHLKMDFSAHGSGKDGVDEEQQDGSVGLVRAIQRAGFASRRAASMLVTTGQVKVNSVVCRDPFHPVLPEDDIFMMSHNQKLRFEPPRLWIYNKPTGTKMTKEGPGTYLDFRKHAAVLGLEHLVPVGSLPTLATGIILLTNDGDLARFLSHPQANLQSTWQLRVKPAISPLLASKWNAEGVRINGVLHTDFEFNVLHSDRAKYAIKVKTRGSKMRMGTLMEHLGRKVVRGGRVSVGPYQLRGLGVSGIREVAVPPFYMKYVNPVWQPFVERDWPYFRSRRVHKLKACSRVRQLSDREREELDTYTHEEMQGLLAVSASEVETEARDLEALLKEGPPLLPPEYRSKAGATAVNMHQDAERSSRVDDALEDEAPWEAISDRFKVHDMGGFDTERGVPHGRVGGGAPFGV